MNRTVLKNALREIKSSFTRYLSIFAITALGVGFFAGITASPYDMRYSAENYYDRLDLADFRLVSSFGFDENDVVAINALDFDMKVYAAYFSDLILQDDNSESVVRVMTIPDGGENLPLNKIEIIDGRFPERADECVVDGRWYTDVALIGEKIAFKSGDKDADVGEVLENAAFTVVGVCRTPLYPSDDTRGYTMVGNGVIQFAVFIPESNFKYDYYTEVYAQFGELREFNCYSGEYAAAAAKIAETLESAGERRSEERLGEIVARAEKEIAKAENELNAAKREALEELADAKKKLDDAKTALDGAKAEIDAGEAALEESRAALLSGEERYELAVAAYGEEAMARTRAELDYGWAEYEKGRAASDDGTAEYERGLADYEQGLADYIDGEREAEEKFAEANRETEKARRDLAELEKPVWYVFDRDDNPGYTEYGENADRINSIAKAFPVFFLLVAVLVCSTTISRMAEEQRVQLGLFKALGYGNGAIMFKYMLYAVSAAVFGSVAGLSACMKLFPYVIITAYQMMYNFPDAVMPYDLKLSLISVAASGGLTALVVFLSTRKELSESPARLMRPKAPKKGKRVFLEKIGFIWNRVGFSGKVTFRNIFRYKQRMLMTVTGIAGCTALTLTAFALKDGIGDVAKLQFGKVAMYSGYSLIDEKTNASGRERLNAVYGEYGCETLYVYEKVMPCEYGGKSVELTVAVIEDAERAGGYFSARNRVSGEEYDLSRSGAIITEKAARLLGVKDGDTVTLRKSETEKTEVKIGGVSENYAWHYLRVSEEVYRGLFGGEPEYGSVYFKGVPREDQDGLAARLLDEKLALATVYVSDYAGGFEEMINTLNSVIVILIFAAGALSVIVLYNLTNINIRERIREISTLKVLGFHDLEVDMYVFRENLLLTLLGTGFGLAAGRFLSMFVIRTAEVDDVMFGRDIHLSSYIFAAVVTMAFSVLVSAFMHFYLKKTDMVEALKSAD
ncbi:MAG: hypothetical protein LBI38_02900 [Oscillospiraceae bacterium]|jgi:putative ABC transport system permease protein|nr:hypothetical protein [Oscillospiraceae bacterium]